MKKITRVMYICYSEIAVARYEDDSSQTCLRTEELTEDVERDKAIGDYMLTSAPSKEYIAKLKPYERT